MTEDSTPKVLCVDDEPQVLEGLERSLFEHFEVVTANSGFEALAAMEEEGPFPVVVSDMRMPKMDGAAFLTEARKRFPDTVRILLTGHADMDSALAAVNHGNIFRFLCKPCEQSVLVKTLQDSVEMHRLLTLERELLASTLNGAVKMMVKLMEIVAPAAFQKASAIQGYVSHVCKVLKVENAWVFESAALLSRSGHVVLPAEVIEKIDEEIQLSAAEQQMLRGAYGTAASLVNEVPRLEEVSDIIAALAQSKKERSAAPKDVQFGASLLEAADHLDKAISKGVTVAQAVAKLDILDPRVRVALLRYRGQSTANKTQLVQISGLRSRMLLDQDAVTEGNMIIARKGQELTSPMIDRLKNFHKTRGIKEPIRVVLAEAS